VVVTVVKLILLNFYLVHEKKGGLLVVMHAYLFHVFSKILFKVMVGWLAEGKRAKWTNTSWASPFLNKGWK